MIEKELVYQIVGYAMAALNEIGHGLREKTYENGLCVDFVKNQIIFEKQKRFPVFYRDVQIDEFIPDLIVGERVVVETKVVETITDEHVGQVLNYLKITGLKVGVILNFKHAEFEWKRVVLSK